MSKHHTYTITVEFDEYGLAYNTVMPDALPRADCHICPLCNLPRGTVKYPQNEEAREAITPYLEYVKWCRCELSFRKWLQEQRDSN